MPTNLFAKTGTGKTSLINAGVRPRLRDRGYETFFVRVRKDPVESAVAELRAHPQKLGLEGKTLAEQLENAAKRLRQPIVIFFDQFEEFFIYVKADSEKGQEFISDVASLYYNQESGVHIVFSMREEWFVEMDAFRDQIPTIFHNESNLRLRWFNESQARDAIRLPAEKFGVKIEDDLLDQMIADLSDGGAIEPAQLQIVCDTLWRRREDREDSRLTLGHYRQLGQQGSEANIAIQVLYQRLEEQFEKIATEEQLQLLMKLLPELRTPQKTKYIRDVVGLIKDLETDENSLRELIKQLEEWRMIRTSRRDDLDVIELTHDYLVGLLDDLLDKVKIIWSRRILKESISKYEEHKELMARDHLTKISDYAESGEIKGLTFSREQTAFLLRSALAQGAYVDLWFDQAARNDAGGWEILSDEINNKDVDTAYNVAELLQKLLLNEQQASKAFKILEKGLNRDELASKIIYELGHIETNSAIKLLKRALGHDKLASDAQVALRRLAGSKMNLKVASQARSVLASLVGYEISREPLGREAQPRGPIPEERYRVRLPEKRYGSTPPREHFTTVIGAMKDGVLVPILGAGVNLCGRPQDENWHWQPDGQYLPSHNELAQYLAESLESDFGRHLDRTQDDLLKVSQYIAVAGGSGPLYRRLRRIFNANYPPTLVHKFLAALPAELESKNSPERYQLIVTTNYDDVLERAFREAGEPYDVVFYMAEGEQRGKFWHVPFEGEAKPIERPNEYRSLPLNQRTVILKIHGAVDRHNSERDSFIITEDDYINYLSRDNILNLFPITLLDKLKDSHFLFLGYGLRDWNERVILHRIWGEQKLAYNSWAVQLGAERLDQDFWRRRNVEVFDVGLDDYVIGFQEPPPAGVFAAKGIV